MKRILFLAFAILAVVGCAQLRQGKADFATCWNDPACREEATAKAESLSSKAAAIAVVSPIPGTAAVVKPIVAGFGLVTFLVLGGRAMRRKQETTPQ